jgi:OOP family OmpA-OmpF porin
MRRIIMALLIALLLRSAPAAAGGGEAGDWELGPYVGYGWLDHYGLFEPKNHILYGGRVGFFFTPRWSLEPSVQRISTKTDLDPSLPLQNEKADLTAYRLNLLYNFRPTQTFRPFLTGGVGCEHFDVHSFGKSEDRGWNAGGGFRWFWRRGLAFRLDERFVSTKVGAGLNETQSNFESTAGLGLVFGGGKTPIPDIDSDGDGVLDKADRCPYTPSHAKVDAYGCPYDTDGDGVLDGIDRCPDTQHGCEVDAFGCPLDSDHDGVCDGLDQCADTPRDKKVDEKGCPLAEAKAPPLFVEKKVVVLEGVEFANDRAVLRPASLTTLDRVAASLRDWPDVKVEVQGHTSEPGTWAYNLELSQRRAEAVRAYLVTKGVAGYRLAAKGYGKSRMIAPNNTQEGQQRNRRVELHEIE